eukprot:769169-Lingulodinium_polyedra.AAC.1
MVFLLGKGFPSACLRHRTEGIGYFCNSSCRLGFSDLVLFEADALLLFASKLCGNVEDALEVIEVFFGHFEAQRCPPLGGHRWGTYCFPFVDG